MAKILFIAVNAFYAEGLRSMSSVLKENGHQSYIIFLKKPVTDTKICKRIEKYDWVGINERGEPFIYARGPGVTKAEQELLFSLIEDIKPDLIGFSVTTPLKRRTADISKTIKEKYNMPIVWGGSEPTVNAEDCLNYCDIVCVGEGEGTILDIANRIDDGTDIIGVKNLAYLKNGKFIQNPLYPLIANLDELPSKDIYTDNKFYIENHALVKNFNMADYLENFSFSVIGSRGCPFNCSYCCENFFKRLYSPENFLRRRSPSNIIKELKEAIKIMDIKKVIFQDEVFSLDCNWLQEFKDMYKRDIGIPFICYIYPSKDIERQLKILKETGLFLTCLALQSGSERINREIFNRAFNKELYLQTAHILKSMGIRYYVDVITYNPFETEKDLQATLDVLTRLPKPYSLCVNKLYILNGTRIYDLFERFRNEPKNKDKALPDRIFNYYSRLFWLARRHSRYLVRFIQEIRVFGHSVFMLNLSSDLIGLMLRLARKLTGFLRRVAALCHGSSAQAAKKTCL